jgi:WD40 repeat protein
LAARWTIDLPGTRCQIRRLTNFSGSCLSNTTATADGKRLAFLQWADHRAGYVGDVDAGGTRILNLRQFTSDVYDTAITDWTPDSKMVVIVQNRLDHYMIYKQLLNGDTPEPIVSPATSGLMQNALLSPDGKWVIALVYPIKGGPPAPWPLVRIPITGGSPQLIFELPPQSTAFCARPPSNLCAVAESTEDGKQRIVTTFDPVKGRGAELARFEIDHSPKGDNSPLSNISPDGTRLAVSGGPKGPIQILSLRGQPTRVIQAKSLDDMQSFNWAADGKGLFISNAAKRGSELLHMDLQGNVVVLWNCSEGSCFAVPSPDGHHLAIYSEQRSANMWMMENF